MKVVNIPSTDRVKELRAEEYGNRVFVIPGHRAAMNPESRDSGFDASHRPGMTAEVLVCTAALTNSSVACLPKI